VKPRPRGRCDVCIIYLKVSKYQTIVSILCLSNNYYYRNYRGSNQSLLSEVGGIIDEKHDVKDTEFLENFGRLFSAFEVRYVEESILLYLFVSESTTCTTSFVHN